MLLRWQLYIYIKIALMCCVEKIVPNFSNHCLYILGWKHYCIFATTLLLYEGGAFKGIHPRTARREKNASSKRRWIHRYTINSSVKRAQEFQSPMRTLAQVLIFMDSFGLSRATLLEAVSARGSHLHKCKQKTENKNDIFRGRAAEAERAREVMA